MKGCLFRSPSVSRFYMVRLVIFAHFGFWFSLNGMLIVNRRVVGKRSKLLVIYLLINFGFSFMVYFAFAGNCDINEN